MKILTQGRSRGFSLLEVLIAVVIMSFGLLALANLQGTLMRASGYTKAQSAALSLAKDMLERQRDFISTAGYQALTDSTTFPDGSTTKTLGGVNYTMTTTVDRYAFESDPDGDPSTQDGAFAKFATDTGALGSGYTSTNEYKRISVTVNWTSAVGDAESITVEDAIGGLPPENTGKLARRKADASNRGPKVIIEDPGNQSGVIPIAVGNGSETAATNPRPEISGNKNKALQEVQFDIYTYAAINGTDNAQAQSRVETYVVGCKCDASASAVSGLANTAFRPTYWDGEKYAVPEQAGYSYKAAEGDLGSGANAEGVQSQICDRCCGEHHDPSASTGPKFSPRLKEHNHYNWDYTTGQLIDSDTSDSDIDPSKDVYYEACRLIRVNGTIRTAADPYNSFFNLLKTESDFTGFDPDSTAALNYEKFVKSYIDTQYRQGSASSYNTDLSDTAANALAVAQQLDSPSVLSLEESAQAWFHARGLYVDYLETEARTALTTAKDNCDEGTSDAAKLTCTLEVLPFTSINLTEISDWEPATSGDIGIDQLVVTLQAFDLSDAANNFIGSNPIRGLGTALSAGDVNATAKVRTSTVGLLADPNYLVHPDTILNEQSVSVKMQETDTQAINVKGVALGGKLSEAIVAGGTVKGETNDSSNYDGAASLTTIGIEINFTADNTLTRRSSIITLVGPTGGNCEFTILDGSGTSGDTEYTLSIDDLNAEADDIGGDCDPSVDGTWTLVITSESNRDQYLELSWRMTLSLARTYKVLWTGSYSPPASSSSYATVDPDTNATCTSVSLSGALTSECVTTVDSEATKLTLGKYNYQSLGTTGAASCLKGNGAAISCPSVARQVCKNYSVDSLTSSNGSAVIGAGSVTGNGTNTETTTFAIDPIQPDDVLTAVLSEGASTTAACVTNNCTSIVWTCP